MECFILQKMKHSFNFYVLGMWLLMWKEWLFFEQRWKKSYQENVRPIEGVNNRTQVIV
jgi:hypothetical protein